MSDSLTVIWPVPETPVYTSFPPSSAQEGQVWWDSGRQGLVVYSQGQWVSLGSPHVIDGPQLFELNRWFEYNSGKLEILIKLIENFDELLAKYPALAEAAKEFEAMAKLHKDLNE